MPVRRHLVGRTIAGLLLIAMVAACSVIGPDLHVAIDNTDGPREVTVTVESSGPGSGEDVNIPPGQGAEWSVPLGSRWDVTVDGRHVIRSGDRTGLALPSPGQGQDVMIRIQVAADGTVILLDAQ